VATWAEIQANIDSIYTSIHDNLGNVIGGSETGAGANALSIPPPPQNSGVDSQITLIVFVIVLVIILFVVWYLFFR
jgi:hypothetical protein